MDSNQNEQKGNSKKSKESAGFFGVTFPSMLTKVFKKSTSRDSIEKNDKIKESTVSKLSNTKEENVKKSAKAIKETSTNIGKTRIRKDSMSKKIKKKSKTISDSLSGDKGHSESSHIIINDDSTKRFISSDNSGNSDNFMVSVDAAFPNDGISTHRILSNESPLKNNNEKIQDKKLSDGPSTNILLEKTSVTKEDETGIIFESQVTNDETNNSTFIIGEGTLSTMNESSTLNEKNYLLQKFEDSTTIQATTTTTHPKLSIEYMEDLETDKNDVNDQSYKLNVQYIIENASTEKISIDNLDFHREHSLVSILQKEDSERSLIKKNVSFRDTLVSSVHVPPSLFVDDSSADEIIEKYSGECEKLKIKPYDRIIKQVSEIKSFKERIPAFDLKGLRIDYKQAECLEEIFKHLRVDWLDLSNTFLEDEACVTLCEIFEFYDTPVKLCLSGNSRIGYRGWCAVATMIQKCASLEFIDLSRTVFTEQIIGSICRCFRTPSSLKIVHLEGCYLNGSRLSALAISLNRNIEELYLAENKISASDGNSLMHLLSNNQSLKLLDLRNNSLQDAGLLKLSQGLTEQINGGLEVLHLWNNYITQNGISPFVPVLNMHPTLHTINLGRNRISDEGMIQMKISLIKNKKLQRLGLANNRISNPGAVALAELIADTNNLLRLDIRENNIGLAGLIALSQAMQINYSIFKLDFNRHIKVDSSMSDIMTRLIDDIRICCLRNRQLARGVDLDEIQSMNSVLSDEHSITQSLKTLPPSALPSPQKSADGTTNSFWQLLSKFTRAKLSNPISKYVLPTERRSLVTSISSNKSGNNKDSKNVNLSDPPFPISDTPLVVSAEHNSVNVNRNSTSTDIPPSLYADASLALEKFGEKLNNMDVITNVHNNSDTKSEFISSVNHIEKSCNDSPNENTGCISKSETTHKSDSSNQPNDKLIDIQNEKNKPPPPRKKSGRFLVHRVVEQYDYEKNYPIGRINSNLASVNYGYEISTVDTLSNVNEGTIKILSNSLEQIQAIETDKNCSIDLKFDSTPVISPNNPAIISRKTIEGDGNITEYISIEKMVSNDGDQIITTFKTSSELNFTNNDVDFDKTLKDNESNSITTTCVCSSVDSSSSNLKENNSILLQEVTMKQINEQETTDLQSSINNQMNMSDFSDDRLDFKHDASRIFNISSDAQDLNSTNNVKSLKKSESDHLDKKYDFPFYGQNSSLHNKDNSIISISTDKEILNTDYFDSMICDDARNSDNNKNNVTLNDTLETEIELLKLTKKDKMMTLKSEETNDHGTMNNISTLSLEENCNDIRMNENHSSPIATEADSNGSNINGI